MKQTSIESVKIEFEASYIKAKETLYTEEQVKEAMFKVYVECENKNNYFEVEDKIIKSLKQPKKKL